MKEPWLALARVMRSLGYTQEKGKKIVVTLMGGKIDIRERIEKIHSNRRLIYREKKKKKNCRNDKKYLIKD